MQGGFHGHHPSVLGVFNSTPDVFGNVRVFDAPHHSLDRFAVRAKALKDALYHV